MKELLIAVLLGIVAIAIVWFVAGLLLPQFQTIITGIFAVLVLVYVLRKGLP